jgi:hypothetical protein
MKTFYAFAVALALGMTSCSTATDDFVNDLTPQSKAVTFRMSDFDIVTRTSLAEAQTKELYVFDGSQLLAKQLSTDEDYGTVTLCLDYGNHNLSFVSTSGNATQTGATLSGKLGHTFGKLVPLSVDGNTSNQSIVLPRINYAIYVTTLDAIPTDVTNMRLTIGNICRNLNVQTLGGVDPQTDLLLNVSVASEQGKTYSNFVAGFCSTLDTEESTSVKIEFLNGSSVVSAHTVTVPVISNRKTIIKGHFFGTNAKGAVSVNTTWLEDEEVDI